MTATDLGVQLGRLGEPFLLLGEIENHLRRAIDKHFTKEDILTAKKPDDPRAVDGAKNLGFGEYVRLFESPENWNRLQFKLDRAEFIKGLSTVRDIRNNIMHFDPDGPSPDELDTLRHWVKFFQRLANLTVL